MTQELRAKAAAVGVSLSDNQVDLFRRYAEELEAAGRKFNLTGVPPERFVDEHFIDSLTLLQSGKIGDGAWVADVGSGAGLPGLALKIAQPKARLVLIESNMKKADFLKSTIDALGLKDIDVYSGRAEEAGRDPALRERMDVVVVRGVAGLPVLLEYALPLAKPGGWVLAMKGPKAADEVGEAAAALTLLAGRVEAVKRPLGRGAESGKVIIMVEKTGRTPEEYPRKVGRPTKRPLGEDKHRG